MDERIVGQWKELLRGVSNYIRDFEDALDGMENDADFMRAYGELYRRCGDILDGMRTPLGDLDDLREAVAAREGK